MLLRTSVLMLACGITSLASLLAGCAGQEPPPAAPPAAIVAAIPPRPATPSVVPKPVARVLSKFSQVEETELHAVTRPRVTPEFVRAVHAAHLEARQAVTALEHEKLRPSSATLSHAQAAVGKLDDVLATVPEDGP